MWSTYGAAETTLRSSIAREPDKREVRNHLPFSMSNQFKFYDYDFIQEL